jgi:thiamine biosynthesis lipoprotein
MNRIEFHAMGSRILAVVDDPTPAAGRALQCLPGWFEDWEQVLSRFRFDSELSRLNQSAGRPVAVSETLWSVFMAAREADEFTGGLVRPTILNALVQAGYDRSFDLLPAACSAAHASALDLPQPTTAISWDEPTRSLCLPASVQLDFGGVAKGWAARQAAGQLMEFGPALVDAGGDIAISAPCLDGQPWAIGIRDPFHPGRDFETLRLQRGGWLHPVQIITAGNRLVPGSIT